MLGGSSIVPNVTNTITCQRYSGVKVLLEKSYRGNTIRDYRLQNDMCYEIFSDHGNTLRVT